MKIHAFDFGSVFTPSGLCELPDQTIIVSDYYNGNVWKVFPDGSKELSPVEYGDQLASICPVPAICPVPDGYIISDSFWRVRRVLADGTLVWDAQLENPGQCVLFENTVFVANGLCVKRLDVETGIVLGNFGDDRLQRGKSIAIDQSCREILVTDSYATCIYAFCLDTFVFKGLVYSFENPYDMPHGICFDSSGRLYTLVRNSIYIIDRYSKTLVKPPISLLDNCDHLQEIILRFDESLVVTFFDGMLLIEDIFADTKPACC